MDEYGDDGSYDKPDTENSIEQFERDHPKDSRVPSDFKIELQDVKWASAHRIENDKKKYNPTASGETITSDGKEEYDPLDPAFEDPRRWE